MDILHHAESVHKRRRILSSPTRLEEPRYADPQRFNTSPEVMQEVDDLPEILPEPAKSRTQEATA